MAQSQWSEQQQYCLAQMGVDSSYLEQVIVFPVHKGVHQKTPRQEKSPIKSQISDYKPTLKGNSSLPVAEVSIAAASEHSEKKPKVFSPTPANVSSVNHFKAIHSEVSSQGDVQENVIVVIGHQAQFDDLLLGQQLVADLCFYLDSRLDHINYIRLSAENYVSQLGQFFGHSNQFLNEQNTFNKDEKRPFYVIIPQGEEQAETVEKVLREEPSLLKQKERLVILPPLTILLSEPQAKAQVLKTLLMINTN